MRRPHRSTTNRGPKLKGHGTKIFMFHSLPCCCCCCFTWVIEVKQLNDSGSFLGLSLKVKSLIGPALLNNFRTKFASTFFFPSEANSCVSDWRGRGALERLACQTEVDLSWLHLFCSFISFDRGLCFLFFSTRKTLLSAFCSQLWRRSVLASHRQSFFFYFHFNLNSFFFSFSSAAFKRFFRPR